MKFGQQNCIDFWSRYKLVQKQLWSRRPDRLEAEVSSPIVLQVPFEPPLVDIAMNQTPRNMERRKVSPTG
jgi:hypothetical protein